MSLFSRAIQQLPLQPWERAVLKLVQTFVLSVIVIFLSQLSGVLAKGGPLNWDELYIPASTAVIAAAYKFWTAHSDTIVADALQVLATGKSVASTVTVPTIATPAAPAAPVTETKAAEPTPIILSTPPKTPPTT